MHHLDWPRPSFMGDLLILLAGALLPLAFAPYNYHIIAVVCPALLFWQLQNARTLKRATLRGFLFGCGFFGFGTHWVYFSMANYGNMSSPLALAATVAFIVVLALFFALQSHLYYRWRCNLSWDALFTFPASWVFAEWCRSWVLSGFPWLLLGYSQTQGALSGYAPLLGSLGLSYLLCVCGAAIVLLLSPLHRSPWLPFLLMVSVWVGGAQLHHVQWSSETGKSISVGLVQGNIPFSEKWSSQDLDAALTQYVTLSRKLKTDLIVWPENAIATPYRYAKSFIDDLTEWAKATNKTLITGVPFSPEDGVFSNSLISIGKNTGRYDKQHLVMFAETLPAPRQSDWVLSKFNIPHAQLLFGKTNQGNLRFDDQQIAPFICYDVVYADTVRRTLPAANVLLTISDDAWYGRSVAAAQHLQIAQMRALESQRYHLFATNSGLTAVIKPDGSLAASAEMFVSTTVTADVQMRQGTTPWILYGNWPALLLTGLALALSAVLSSGRREHRREFSGYPL